MIDPKGRVVMVSGANRGIGAAIAKCLYDKGYTLSLGARDVSQVEALTVGWDADRVLLSAYDARDKCTAKCWVAQTVDQFGRLDGIVNNAARYSDFTIEYGDLDDLDDVLAVNIKGPLLLLRYGMPHLRKTGQGRVVSVASMSGKRVIGKHVAYAMSKFALMALTAQTRSDGWGDGVRATALCPGFVATEMAEPLTDRLTETMTQPEELAEIASLAIALPNTASIPEFRVQSLDEPMI